MSRLFVVHDARGERQLDEQALPLSVGGEAAGDIAMPGTPADQVVAYIATKDGYAFIQAADETSLLYHNHEQLSGSRWLKSGDEIQFGDAVMSWTVQGDMVIIATRTQPLAAAVTPPADTPTLLPPKRAVPEITPHKPPRGARRKLHWAVFGVFLLLLLVSAFVLLATPVAVEVIPEPEQQAIHGFPPTVKIGKRRLALPGRYTVQASREGYRPLQADIEVRRGSLQTFSLTLEERPGRVHFQLQPDVDYRVFVDDAPVPTAEDGVTEIPAGTQQLRIETDRYLPVFAQLEIAGRGMAQQFAYQLQPGWADVTISSEPAGAQVHIDGVLQGITPLVTGVMGGEHTLELSLEKFKTVSMQHAFAAGTEVQLDNIVLSPADGRLAISSEPAGATISVAGVFHSTTPATLSLASTEQHTVRLSKPGYQVVDKAVTLAPDESQQLAVTLPAEYGIVFVTARPADAELKIDGKPAGEATRRLRLTTRPHTLTFSKPGYLSQQVTVTPRAGVSKNVDIALKTQAQEKADRKAASMPATRTTAAGQR
ncbi:MAG: PEGA domain-containing protein, partial [Gammaproteobacteria bacterium]